MNTTRFYDTDLSIYREHLTIFLGKSPSTATAYSIIVASFADWLEKSTPHQLATATPTDILAWLKHLYYHKSNIQSVTRSTKLSALKSFYNYLEYTHAVSSNPASLVPSPTVHRPSPSKFTTNQLQRIFSSPDISAPIGVRDMAMLKLLYGAGPRVNEIRMLNATDLTQLGSSIYVHFQKTKNGKQRTVHLVRHPSSALTAWLLIRQRHTTGPELFPSMSRNQDGARLSKRAFNSILKRHASAVGIKNDRVFTHKMRSTFATDLYDCGFGVIEISIQMGHSSVKTTQGYIAISEKMLQKTAIPQKRWNELTKDFKNENR